MNKYTSILLEFHLFLVLSAFETPSILKAPNPTPKYIRSLIDFENLQDALKNHDVAVIRLEESSKSEIFDDTTDELFENNRENGAYIHTSFDSVPSYRIHAFSFYIIFSDMADYVRQYETRI